MTEAIYVETGTTWSFAGAIEWPGWCRHAKGERDPIAELLAYGDRNGAVLSAAGLTFEPSHDLEVVESLEGNKGTEWGVPSVVPAADRRPFDNAEIDRQVAILQACWSAFDRAVTAAEGHALRKGPRGGGRDLPRLIDHCVEGNKVYLSKLGSRKPRIESDDPREVEAALRERTLETLRDRAAGRSVREPSRTREPWLPRWFVRYAAWHTLIHAWEIEDRRLDEPA